MGVLGTVVISRSSDRTGDRTRHLAFVYGMSALAIAGSAFAPSSPVLAYLLLCVTGLFIYAGNPLFWSLAASFRTGAAGAATDRADQHHRAGRRAGRPVEHWPSAHATRAISTMPCW